VWGIGLIRDWHEGWFTVEGFTPTGVAPSPPTAVRNGEQTDEESHREILSNADARTRVLQAIWRRRGQRQFRDLLLTAYDQTCAVSACNVQEALEAAHIRPYRGSHTNHIVNGLLLRSDIHTLFDLGLLGINPKDMRVVVAAELEGSEYAEFDGVPVRVPANASDRPSPILLRAHLTDSGLIAE